MNVSEFATLPVRTTFLLLLFGAAYYLGYGTLRQEWRKDSPGSGIVAQYSRNGRPWRTFYDRNRDGKWDLWIDERAGHPYIISIDEDGDGVPSCIDQCDNDPRLIIESVCGCFETVDTDGDGRYDCEDGCPNDPNKFVPGICGCGVPDIDTDGDGKYDCEDGCPNDPNKIAPGVCGCGVPESLTDSDGDGPRQRVSVDAGKFMVVYFVPFRL